VKPSTHWQEKLPLVSTQVPWFWHGAVAHSAISDSQRLPWKPGKQLQEKVELLSTHCPLFWHGEEAQKSILMQAVLGSPEYPGMQEHAG
jgi:hypothetical protein